MECNRDEALRAKEIAEKKFLSKDLSGAKKFALKAQTLFPTLEGISQMIATLDVHQASEIRVSGQKDWYAILSVNPNSDDETLKKQYRRLALQLHPDKNKSIGAESAFQLISEAWMILSDKPKRLSYNQSRNIREVTKQNHPSTAGSSSSKAGGSNGFFNYAKAAEKARQKAATQAAAPKAPHRAAKQSTFWTCCAKCKMQYEYLRVYLNHNLLCPNCKDPFLAVETPKPGSSTDFARASVHFQWGPFNSTAGAASAGASSAAAAQAANVVHQAYEKVRREREEAQERLKKEREEREREKLRQEKMKRSHGFGSSGSSSSSVNGSNAGFGQGFHNEDQIHKKMRGEEREGGNVIPSYFSSSRGVQMPGTGMAGSYVSRGLSPSPFVLFRAAIYKLDTKSILQEQGKNYVMRKLQALELLDGEKAKKVQKTDPPQTEKPKPTEENALKVPPTKNQENQEDQEEKEEEEKMYDVEDPEFHDFDMDRIEKAFRPDQIWATYDDEDGMPRYYAFIQKVFSSNPFKVKMTFLTSKSNNEFSSDLEWVSSGFTKTCGEFRFGKYEVKNSVNVFSHCIKWEKGPKGVVRIFPHKGDIWALYKNWDKNWVRDVKDEIMYKYDMVEISEEYSEEKGIIVVPLVKVKGFKAVFKKDEGEGKEIRIEKEEMFRFSHQVPAYRFNEKDCKKKGGEKGDKVVDLMGCVELDPAATPADLLQVID